MRQISLRLLKRVVRSTSLLALAWVGSAYSAVIFQDDFSSGDFDKTNNQASWTSRVDVNIASSPSIVGSNSAKFTFKGSSDLSADAFSEMRFDLGGLYKEVWIQFYLYVPDNYYHRDASSTDNNKIFRLWPADYNNNEKVGLSAWRGSDGGSSMIADWSTDGRGIGPKGETFSAFITSEDKGRWMKLRIQIIAAESTSSPGSMRVWKNDELVIDNFQIMDSYYSGEPHAYRYGYLLGWSNSGFNENTELYIDGVIFATSESDLVDGVDGTGSPPKAPEIEVQ